MVKPTPWGAAGDEPFIAASAEMPATGPESPTAPGEPAAGSAGGRRTVPDAVLALREGAERLRESPRLRGKWGFVAVAISHVVLFVLLFQHWMVAHGPDGMAAANAFGRIDATTKYLNAWSHQGMPPSANLTGFWAVATVAGIGITLASILVYIISGTTRFARLAARSCLVTTLLVILTVLYLTTHQKSLKSMTIRRWDLGGQVGSWLDWAFNDGIKPMPGLSQTTYVASGALTPAAMAAIVIAVGAAVVALTTLPDSERRRLHIPWRISVRRAAPGDTATASVTAAASVTATSTSAPEAPESAAAEPVPGPAGPAPGETGGGATPAE